MDRWTIAASTFCFLVSFAWTMFALGAGRYRRSRFNLLVMSCGFALQTLFLWQRGQMLGRCPLTNLFEVLIFLAWSMVLFYLVVGSAYRLTLLGAFTAPFATVFQMFALLAPIDRPSVMKSTPNAWLEFHAAVSVLAYGAFALACVAGVMFLAQERQLKTHHLRSIFFHLPPISELATAIRQLMATGLLLLTAGLAAGFVVGSPHSKIAIGAGVWLLYALLLWKRKSLSPRRAAGFAVAAFCIALISLWAMNSLPAVP